MSLQKYVRQVRPRNESYIPPVDKVQNFLTEASSGIKPADLWKRDNLQRFIDEQIHYSK